MRRTRTSGGVMTSRRRADAAHVANDDARATKTRVTATLSVGWWRHVAWLTRYVAMGVARKS